MFLRSDFTILRHYLIYLDNEIPWKILIRCFFLKKIYTLFAKVVLDFSFSLNVLVIVDDVNYSKNYLCANKRKQICIFYINVPKTMKTNVAAGLCGKFFVWYSDCRLQSCNWKSFVYILKCGHAKNLYLNILSYSKIYQNPD